MKYNTHANPAFAAAFDAFDNGWKGGPAITTAEDLLHQPNFAAALDTFGVGLPEQNPLRRELCIGTRCDDTGAASCCLAGACAC